MRDSGFRRNDEQDCGKPQRQETIWRARTHMARPLKSLAKCCRIEGPDNILITGLALDSRLVRPGYLFAALPGTRYDGLQFVPDALERGARAVLVKDDAKLPPLPEGVAVVRAAIPAQALAHIAARFYVHQPVTIVAITGTNGKSTVAEFTQQIWAFMGFRAASMGTLGVRGPEDLSDLNVSHTTPDVITLHEVLAKMRRRGISHLSMEASSHGLAQYRMDGVRLTAGGYTNLSRDHLDYHGSMDAYFEAKMRLFEELLNPPAAAVINMDGARAEEVAARAGGRGLCVFGVGEAGEKLKILFRRLEGLGQHLHIRGEKREYRIFLPLVGTFQAENALVAAGLVIAAGGPEEEAVLGLERLKGARGRMELVGRTREGAPVFVDYAHTPDALRQALSALRPYVKGRLVVVFGAGGDRDAGKRPEMGKVAAELADVVIVTDDNPRSEEPADIRAQVMAGCPQAREIAGRTEAIAAAIAMLRAGDILLVAGKGHETGQEVAGEILPFSDHEEIRKCLKTEKAA